VAAAVGVTSLMAPDAIRLAVAEIARSVRELVVP
jgi:hypothetical protein